MTTITPEEHYVLNNPVGAAAELIRLRRELEEAKQELSRWICVWCNHITLATGDPDADYAALQAHVLSCKDSPLVQAKAELAEAQAALLRETDRTQDAWRKQWALEKELAEAHGKIAELRQALAEEMSDEINVKLAEAQKDAARYRHIRGNVSARLALMGRYGDASAEQLDAAIDERLEVPRE